MSVCPLPETISRSQVPLFRVSILMLTYNRPQFLSRAIQSVLDQTFQDWELIVVHDGPHEFTAKIMHDWENIDTRIRYFRRNPGGNIANATNFGLAQARSEYIAILDDDDYWASPSKLTKQVSFLDEKPDYAACGGGMIVMDQTGRERLRYLKRQNDQDLKRWALLANPIAHSTAMFRTSLIAQCGGYDETLPGFQDWDVFLKLGQHGKLYNFPEELTYYTLWDGGGSFAQSKTNARSALRIVRRHGKAYQGFMLAFSLAALHCAYAHLPYFVRRLSFSFLSRAKKTLFSEHRTSGSEQKPSRPEPA